MLGLKVLANATAPALGLEARYWASAAPGGKPERSTDFPNLADATRIDAALDLRGEDFAVHFFNDAARFNFGPEVVPARDQLPFSVRWQGWLIAPSDGERRFVLDANGAARVSLDGATLVGSDSVVQLTAGAHQLTVDYARPEAQVPRLRLSWQRLVGGPLETVGGADVRWQATTTDAALSATSSLAADVALVGLIVLWLGFGLGQVRRASLARAALGAVPLVFLGYGMLLEAPAAGRSTILSGLDDWLVYESSARDILLNGLLLDGGQGHAAPFYGQPLYPYALALAHRLAGESLFGPIALQFAALGLVVVATAVLARRAFGARLDALAAAACFLLLLQLEPEHFKIARQLFNENLYMPLVMASLIVVVGLAHRREPPRAWQALLAGALFGVTAITRSQFLLFVPFGLLILGIAWRRRVSQAVLKTALAVLGLTLVILPVTARNWLVSGQLVPISSGAGASLLEFHRPPPGLVDQRAIQDDGLFNQLHLDPQTRTVLAFARADPRGYLATLLPPAAHSIGLQGRNDPGVYWALFITVLTYIASFGLKRTRELHVWPVHAFVASHLLVLMLFEAETYGYRLVMPMYAPMVVVAAQVPLAVVGYALRVTRHAFSAPRNPQRASRFAHVGWSAIAIGALAWQARTLVDVWPEREPALHGLGGPAAHAASTADRVGASVIYVASADGAARHFGAGSLPGLRYPWFKWFDPTRSLPLTPPDERAVYMLSEVSERALAGDLTPCLGPPDADNEVVADGAHARAQCVLAVPGDAAGGPTFDGLAEMEAVQVPRDGVAGQPLETRLLWQPLVAHPEPHQMSLQLDDPASTDDTLWGNGTLELYPSSQWQPGETLLSRLPVVTDPAAAPRAYRVTLGMAPSRRDAAPASAVWHGMRTDRVPVANVVLSPAAPSTIGALPGDMQLLQGSPLIDGGLELIGARPLPLEVAIGSPLRVGLLWRATEDEPSAVPFKVRLVSGSGAIVAESIVPLSGGPLRAGDLVRAEHNVLIGPRAPSEAMALEVATGEASVRLGSIKLTSRSHVFDSSGLASLATFGDAIELLSAQLEPTEVRPGQRLSAKMRWRSAAEVQQAYKAFVHVLDPTGSQVVAQKDAEPQDGRAPTSGWLVGEVLDDDYVILLPASLSPGSYPVEVGLYEPRTGERLRLADGTSRYLLTGRVTIQ